MGKQYQKFLGKFGSISSIADGTALAPNFEIKKSQFKEFYGTNYPTLRAAEKTLRNLLELLLANHPIETPKVLSRIKDRDECLRKFDLKYRNDVEKTGSDYEIQNYISDLIGLRIICLYEIEIAMVKTVIEENFNIIEITDKTKILTADVDSFGYKGLHLDVMLGSSRRNFPEYENFSDFQFEIQIRSIVQDAWSEVDHKLKYKKQIPNSLKRRIIRLSALFELADQEFGEIRNETNELEKAAVAAAQNSQPTQQNAADDVVDSFSFLALMNELHPGYTFGPEKIDGFLDEIKKLKPDLTIGELRMAISEHREDVQEYKSLLFEMGFRINPFTEMRHILFLYKNSIFNDVLYPRQGNELLAWYSDKSGTA